MNKLYERYHNNRKSQKTIISENNFTYGSLIYFIKKYINAKDKVLDIGCGVGTIDFYLASHKMNVVGIDVSEKAVFAARRDAKSLGLSKQTIFSVLDFTNTIPKAKFNFIICSEVLEHLQHDKIAVARMNKSLLKNGIVIASSPSQNAPLYKMGLLKKFDKEVGHLRRYTLENYISLFSDSGFKILEIKKTEGILRNFLFTNAFGGFLLRILNKRPFSEIVTFIDNLAISVLGESNFYLVAQKK